MINIKLNHNNSKTEVERNTDLCDNSTSLGNPVVPLEYRITHVSLLSYLIDTKLLFS